MPPPTSHCPVCLIPPVSPYGAFISGVCNVEKKPGKTRKTDSSLTASNRPKVTWMGYVTFELSNEHKAALEKFLTSGNDPLDWLPRIALDGVYEVKCKWDSYNNCFAATLYCSKYEHENAGWALPCRASGFWVALRRLAFVHVEVLKEQWHVGANDTGWNDEKW